MEIENRPKLLEGIRVEVEWNEGEHFGTVRGKLDKFSTFGVWAGKLVGSALARVR
jgi:hypothetical protein